jgi:proline iminopeptidase
VVSAVVQNEGYIDVGPGNVWYASAGEGVPLLLLHGGPGATSLYLEPLMVLADDGYHVVRYDQLGSYHSDKPDDLSLWQFPRFVDELETVRQSLGFETMYLLGQSWGAILALEYALHFQQHLRGLILASGAASIAECVAGMNGLRAELPKEMIDTLNHYEAIDETDNPAYKKVIDELYHRHLCRLVPHPDVLKESGKRMAQPVYNTMWGPNEFRCTGNLQSWDRTDRLGEIHVPTLITVGRFDEVVPSCAETMHRGIAGSQLVVFEESSHSAHLEEPERYLEVLRTFLGETDRTATIGM